LEKRSGRTSNWEALRRRRDRLQEPSISPAGWCRLRQLLGRYSNWLEPAGLVGAMADSAMVPATCDVPARCAGCCRNLLGRGTLFSIADDIALVISEILPMVE